MAASKPSIARLLLVAVAVITTAIMAVFAVIEHENNRRHYDEPLARDLATVPDQLAAGLALPLWYSNLYQAGRLIEAAMAARVIESITVRDYPSGRDVLARARDAGGNLTVPEDAPAPGRGLMTASRPILIEGHPVGTVEVALTTAFRDAALRENIVRLAILIFCLDCALIGGVYLLLRRVVLSPLGAVEAYAAKVSRGETGGTGGTGKTVGGGEFKGEIESLRRSIEAMVAELSRRMTALSASREALALAEERFRSIFERAQIGIFLTTWQGRFLTANPALASILGYASATALLASGDSIARLYLYEDERASALAQLAGQGEVDNFRVRFKRADGAIRTGSLRARTKPGPNGEPAMIEGLLEDITDRVSAEEALLESKNLYQSLVEALPLSIMTFDRAGYITFVNQFHLDAFAKGRLDKTAFIGRSIFELPGILSAGLGSKLEGLVAGTPLVLDGEFIPQLSGGGSAWQSVKGIPLHRAGCPAGGILIREDITARRQVEEKLRQAQKHIKNIIDSMPSAVIGVDTGGQVTLFNQAAERDTGIMAEAAVGQRVEDVYPDLAAQMRQVAEAIGRGLPAKTEKIARPKGGRIEYDDVMIYPLTADGAAGAVVRIDDVTERVRIEEMMIQSEKMMSLGGLAAGMAHEINNPLGAVVQGVQNVLRRLDPTAPANADAAASSGLNPEALARYLEDRRVRYFLSGVAEAGERAARIVAGMLEFSRRGAADPVMADAAALIEKTIALAANDYDLKKLHDFRRIEIIRDFDPSLPQIPCIPIEIEQVLLNLLKNAAQALGQTAPGRGAGPAGDGSSPGAEHGNAAEPPRIRISTRRDGASARIEVADNGPGMSEEVRRRVFEPFFTTKEPGTGTGLGLSVSYFIVSQNHGGELTVHSSPGAGAVFRVRLPLAVAALDCKPKAG